MRSCLSTPTVFLPGNGTPSDGSSVSDCSLQEPPGVATESGSVARSCGKLLKGKLGRNPLKVKLNGFEFTPGTRPSNKLHIFDRHVKVSGTAATQDPRCLHPELSHDGIP